MSLATRCTSCGTIFRVVQDQLKVSEGWVRCGRCQEVFNALQNLFDLERESPPPWPPAPAPPPPPEPAWDKTRPVSPAIDPRASSRDADAAGDPANLATQPLLHRPSREAVSEDEPEPEDTGFEDARFNEELLSDEGLLDEPTQPLASTQAPESEPEDAALEVFGASQLEPMPLSRMREFTSVDEPPSFVREADRAARWQHPAVRVALLLLLLLSGALLAAQVGLRWRAEFAANWPESRFVLEPLCDALGCTIGPPRRLENLAVDASGLTQLDVPGQYRLSVVLRNRGRSLVMLPALELSLTDAQGQTLSRRVLTPAELGIRQDGLAAGAELPLVAAFSVGELRVVGYTVEIFYP